ncbi:beta-galactoside alpha-2,6-sialyltransferase 2 isoform X2 [Scyliorhinus canicula]|uniref:beta-galactoside alpha-2,6-sialyltransferase 2 isoform X2 n=1 Tax=Scyliorhinus canicula TaxID=7830 RepID=UPI0018F733D9|nr:beta-galactoside alpha-2,6-sialyltransferase 2 isoform X2 [Scyliorhinus canicula]
MKAKTKQWKQLVLIGILAWALVFLLLFTYFTDFKTDERPASSFTFTETRRLFPIQGNQRIFMGAFPNPKVSASQRENSLLFVNDEDSVHSLHLDSLNDENLKWTQEQDNGEVQVKIRLKKVRIGNQQQITNKLRDEIVKIITKDGNAYEETIIQDAKSKHHKSTMENMEQLSYLEDPLLENLDSLDLEDLEFSKSSSVLAKLWRGNISSGMLNPRLQKAMKDYMNENRHGVQFQRKMGTEKMFGEELLCELKNKVKVRTLDGKEAPFSTPGWKKHIPKIPLNRIRINTRSFRNCAVVTSAGSILNSSLGEEIENRLSRRTTHQDCPLLNNRERMNTLRDVTSAHHTSASLIEEQMTYRHVCDPGNIMLWRKLLKASSTPNLSCNRNFDDTFPNQTFHATERLLGHKSRNFDDTFPNRAQCDIFCYRSFD